MTCHVIWEAFAESAVLFKGGEWIRRKGETEGLGQGGIFFKKRSVLERLAIRLRNSVWSGDSQRLGRERAAHFYHQWLWNCRFSPVFFCWLTQTQSEVFPEVSGVNLGSAVSFFPLYQAGAGLVKGDMWSWPANIRLDHHFLQVFAVSSQLSQETRGTVQIWADISPDHTGFPS